MPTSPFPPSPDKRQQAHRRTVLKSLATASALAGSALFPVLPGAAQHAQHGSTANPAIAYTPKWFTGATRELLSAICDRILPRTDTPGAADAGVADQIDWYATRQENLASSISKALLRVDALSGQPFVSLRPEQQDAVLTKMSLHLTDDDGKAFTLLKDLTIDAYYSSKPGLQGELGWDANTYLPEFPGCTHDHDTKEGA